MLTSVLSNYLKGKLSKEEAVQECRSAYHSCITDTERQFDLDAIKCLPFIHELAHSVCSEQEFRALITEYFMILEHQQEYRYSCILQLNPPATKPECGQLNAMFRTSVASPQNIKDILHNAVAELIARSEFPEDDWNCINCNADACETELKNRLDRLLSYYFGEKPFCLQLYSVPLGQDIYIVL